MLRIEEISSVTNKDRVEIVSTLKALYDDRYYCNTCLIKYDDQQRKHKFCETTAPAIIALHENIQYQTCPGNFFSESALYWVKAEESFEKGIMPFEGSFMRQPNKAIEVMKIIGDFKLQEKIRMQKQANQRLKRGK